MVVRAILKALGGEAKRFMRGRCYKNKELRRFYRHVSQFIVPEQREEKKSAYHEFCFYCLFVVSPRCDKQRELADLLGI